MNKNILKDWAKNEITLAKELNVADEENKKDDHLTEQIKTIIDETYDAAYKVYCQYLDELKEGMNPGIMKSILFQLLNGNVLTPIEINAVNDNDWVYCGGSENVLFYQNKRMNSLYKKVVHAENEKNPIITYTDMDRSICIDINSGQEYFGEFEASILDELEPITTLPYIPLGQIKIYTERFNAYGDEKTEYKSYFDTLAIAYFEFPDGGRTRVMRFFKRNYKTRELVEITKEEYIMRKQKALNGGCKIYK